MDVVSPDMAKPAGRYNMMAKTRCDDHFMARTMHDLLELMRQVGSCGLVVSEGGLRPREPHILWGRTMCEGALAGDWRSECVPVVRSFFMNRMHVGPNNM
jgi:hypothetical protein